jgi:MMPL family/Mycobacterium membrane protein
VKAIPVTGVAARVWIPLVFVVVLAVSGLIVGRLHKVFGSQDLNAGAGAGIEIVQFNPKIVVYDVFGPPGTTAKIDYFRAMAGTGGVVTAAGLVFAVTMASMLGSSLRIIAQPGSTIAIGLLLDTLIVRTLLMPSIATLLGRWFWWPHVIYPRGDRKLPQTHESKDEIAVTQPLRVGATSHQGPQ